MRPTITPAWWNPPAAPFDPGTLSPAIWLKADAIVGLADGDPVTTWEDSSTNNRDATQATGAAKPTYQTGEVNSLPAVLFDGVDDHMISATLTLKPVTMMAVVNVTATATYRSIIASSTTGAMQFRVTSGDQLNILAMATVDIASQTGTIPEGAWLYVTAAYSATGGYAFYENGAADGSGTNNQTINAGPVHVGRFGSEVANMLLAELLIFDLVLADADRQSVDGYIAAKYAL